MPHLPEIFIVVFPWDYINVGCTNHYSEMNVISYSDTHK